MAGNLETWWEAKLATLAEAEAAVEAARHQVPPLPTRADLERLTADLPRLWEAETTSNKDRKRLLRSLIADITVLPEPDHAMARIGLRWHTGATDEHGWRASFTPEPPNTAPPQRSRWSCGSDRPPPPTSSLTYSTPPA